MNFFDKIEKVMRDKRLGVVEFLEKSGISQTSYYALKEGKTKKVSPKTIKKVVKAFPEYKYEWFLKDDIAPNTVKEPAEVYEINGNYFTLDELGVFIADNEEAVLNNNIIGLWIKALTQERAMEILLKEKFKTS